MKLELKHTADGSSTLYLPELDEPYHSINGAVTESEHIFLSMGFKSHTKQNPVVFEVGFGTGLNTLLTAYHAKITERLVFYISVENHPLALKLVKKLNYKRYVPVQEKSLFLAIHEAKWNEPVQLNAFFRLLKIKSDFTTLEKLPVKCDVIYFDAFGPEKQPEMWTQQVFVKLYEWLQPGGVLVTYSVKGEVRRRLNTAGFRTEKLPGPPGKKEMLRAIK